MNTKKLVSTAAMAALTCLAGMVLRWVSPSLVPFSVLPVMVFLSGLILGGEYGALAMFTYIVLGLFGLPVFASAPFGGFWYVAKPTFGYLLGYIAAAYVTGKVYRSGSLWRAALAVLVGLVVMYLFGLGYLYGIMRWVLHRPASVAAVIMTGFTPFILSDVIKAGIAAWVGNEVVRRRKES
ncbi:MAG: biotin transporter BioY [Desulfitobacteriaceae bacterium]